MPDGRKRILSPFTGHKKQKGRGSYQKEEQLEQFLDGQCAFYNGNESDNDENNEQQWLLEGFVNSCYKIVSPILLQKLITNCTAFLFDFLYTIICCNIYLIDSK